MKFVLGTEKSRRSVSRVLSTPRAALDGHSSGTDLTARLTRPTRAADRKYSHAHAFARRRPPLFGLAPGGVYPASPVTRAAVRSYRTVSPLPRENTRGGLFSVALSLGSPPPAVSRHRIPVEPGLSSIILRRQRPSSRLAGVTWYGIGGHVKQPVAQVSVKVPRRLTRRKGL